MSFNLSHHFVYIVNRTSSNDFELATTLEEAMNKSIKYGKNIFEVHSIKFDRIVGKYEQGHDKLWKYIDYNVLKEGEKYFE